MTNKEFLEAAKNAVIGYYNSRAEKTDNKTIGDEDVYVVWLCKTLQNHKALISTNVSDGMYYEITFNGDKSEMYLDAYKKWENICIGLEAPAEEMPEYLELKFAPTTPKNQVWDMVDQQLLKGYTIESCVTNPESGIIIYKLKQNKRRK